MKICTFLLNLIVKPFLFKYYFKGTHFTALFNEIKYFLLKKRYFIGITSEFSFISFIYLLNFYESKLYKEPEPPIEEILFFELALLFEYLFYIYY